MRPPDAGESQSLTKPAVLGKANQEIKVAFRGSLRETSSSFGILKPFRGANRDYAQRDATQPR
jgi:hypothetical protein